MDKSAVWLERYRLLTEWANLARQQVECLRGGFEGERLESILHAKERLMVQLQALPDADPNCLKRQKLLMQLRPHISWSFRRRNCFGSMF